MVDFDLSKKYIRKTHINNEYRREMDDLWNKIPCGFRGCIHLLHPDKYMNIAEILSEAHGYAHDWPLENNSLIDTNPYILQEVLELLVNFDMIGVENANIN